MKNRVFWFAALLTIHCLVSYGQDQTINGRLDIRPLGWGATHIPYSTGDIYLTGYSGDSGGAFIYRTFDEAGYVNRFRVSANGNVGVGISNPSVNFEMYKYDGTNHFRIYTNQHAGTAKIEIAGGVASFGAQYSGWTISHSYNHTNKDLYFGYGLVPETKVVFTENGYVGIGTINPTHKLSVNGTIRAKEVKVETGWSDFVFEEDYQLMTLPEVESFIQKNGHLPDIPSAEEVAESGVNVGEMESKLLQKIEELTLYVIELKKENELQDQKNKKLEMQLEKLQKKIKNED